MKKIAFCFSGQARSFDLTYPYFKKNLFDAAEQQGFDYDIFCAVENDNNADKLNVMNIAVIEKINSAQALDAINLKYKKFIQKNLNNKYYFQQTPKYPVINGLQQFYKIEICNNLKNLYQIKTGIQYDIVVKLRFDLIFLNQIDFNAVYQEVQGGIIANRIPSIEHFIYDHFAFGKTEDMDVYTNIFSSFTNIFQKEIHGFKNKILCGIDSMISKILTFFYYCSNKSKLILLIVEKIFFLKLLFLIKNGVFHYNYERLVCENLSMNKIKVIQGNISFFLLRSNLKEENFAVLFADSKFEK